MSKFKGIKHKCNTKQLSQYPCESHLKNALYFITINESSVAYSEICYAIIKSGGELSDEERRRFEIVREM